MHARASRARTPPRTTARAQLWASTPAHANTDSAARARTQRTCRSAAGVVTPREMLQPAGRARPTAWGEAGAGAAGAACASASLATHANPGGSTVELSDAARALPLPPRPSAAAELDYPALARSPGSAARLFERCYSHAGEVMFPDAPPSAGRSPPRAPGPLADDPATATAMMRGALHAHAAFSGAAGASTALLSFMAAPDVMGDEHGRGRAMVPPDAAGVPRRASASVASLLAAPPPVLPHTPRGANAVAASYSSAGEVLFGAAHAEGGEPARSVSPTLAHLDQRYHGAAGVAATGNTAPEAEHIFARKRRVGVAGARASGGAGVPRVQPPGAVSDSPIAGASEAYAYAADAARLFPHMSSRVGAVVFGAPEPPTRSELLARAVGAAPSGTGGDGGGGGGKLGVQVPPPPSTAGGRGVTWADGTTATSAAGGAAPGELQLPRDSARDAARTPGGRTPGGGGSGLRSAHFGQASAAELRANPFAGACGVPSDPSEVRARERRAVPPRRTRPAPPLAHPIARQVPCASRRARSLTRSGPCPALAGRCRAPRRT